MTFTTLEFRPDHLRALTLQHAQAHHIGALDDPEFADHIAASCAQSVTVLADGRIIACGGIVELWDNRGMIWSLIAKGRPSEFIAVHRAARRMLDACRFRRVEAYVDEGFEQGCRWMEMLGFDLETPFPMRAFAGERDCYLYARVTE